MAQLDVDVLTPCEINTVKHAIPCITNCIGSDQVSAIKMFLLVQILIRLVPAYADFTLDQWKALLKEWQALSESEREADEIVNLGLLASEVGYVLSSDVDAMMTAAKCYFCIPTETRLNLIAGLECLLWQVIIGQQGRNQ